MPSRRDRPNVLLLYTDQQRFDALGYTGNTHIRTLRTSTPSRHPARA